MKKNRIICSLLFIAMAVTMFCGSIGSACVQGMTLAAQAASNTKELFNDEGKFAIARTELIQGAKFKFFDHVWRVVYVNNEADVATFWLDEPLQGVTKAFNNANGESAAEWSNETTWVSGYTSAKIKDTEVIFGESEIRAYLRELATEMIDNSNAKYASRVVPGYVEGSNWDNNKASSEITPLTWRQESPTGITTGKINDKDATLIADYNLTSDDRLWLPCEKEVMNDGVWNLTNTDRNWNLTTTANAVWLRNPKAQPVPENVTDDNKKYYGSHMGVLVGYLTDNSGYYQSQSFFADSINKEYGVRPAIHLSLRNFDGVSPEETGVSPWDGVMQIFFIVVCVLGIIGVVLVIIAVVMKARKNNANPVA